MATGDERVNFTLRVGQSSFVKVPRSSGAETLSQPYEKWAYIWMASEDTERFRVADCPMIVVEVDSLDG
ncbi:hypothetical protein [Haladaptatus halobius]|uniref:hypothetical protein n=1 Tax=Haladaptatus halobius TaxID=2884875 RepID=UPI001D0AEB24|nr:hypothetical protein [Haladaptatus halobius]